MTNLPERQWKGLTGADGNPQVMQFDNDGNLQIITVEPEEGACEWCYLPPGMHDNSCPTLA
jgi:hypothetical protein